MVADSHKVGLTTECIADIAASMTRARQMTAQRQLTPLKFQRECRSISTQIRKLILPSGEELLKQSFTPTMHPLKLSRANGKPETITQWFGNAAMEYSEGEASETRLISFPSEYEHATEVRPLYGLRHAGDLTYQLEDPFDWSAPPLRIGQWMNRKVLQVDDLTISAETLLRSMVNKEGTHVMLNEMATSNPATPVNLRTGDPDDEPYRRANVVKFGGISYVQLFTFLVGTYLVSMMKATLQRIPEQLAGFGISKEVWLDILQTTTRVDPLILEVDRPYEMGFVLEATGGPEQPFAMVGDYQTPSRTVVRAP